MKKKISVLGGIFCAAMLSFAAEKESGSYKGNAISLRQSQEVTLVNEYDPEWKENTDSGVAYYKITLAKYSEATIWITGGNTADIYDFSVSYDMDEYMGEDDVFPSADFDFPEERDDGGTKICYLRREYWDEEDPDRVTFYVAIYGEIGQKCKLNYVPRIESFTVEGEESNPRKIEMTETSQKEPHNLLDDGCYYFKVRLEPGRKYSVRTTGGSAAQPLSINWDIPIPRFEIDPAYSNNTANASYLVYSDSETATDYTFWVSGAEGQPFNIRYWAYPARTPENHPWTELNKEDGYLAVGVPGRVTANDKADRSYFDDIIDEFLVRIKLTKGERWVFETSGSTNHVQMKVYDASGKTLVVNESLGKGSLDVRAAIEAEYDGYYYIGVCDPALEEWESSPAGPEVTIFARNSEEFDAEEDADGFDDADDKWEGASPLIPVPGSIGRSAVDVGAAHGMHVLSGGDWYDWYALPCRSNLTYVLKAEFDGEEVTDLKLQAKVYRMVDGVMTRMTSGVSGSVTPAAADSSTMQFVFKADRNGMFYVRVNVLEGIGLDYPAHSMYAMVYGDDDLGLLTVNTKGVDGQWYFTDDKNTLYANGATVAVATGIRNIRFTDDAAYKTPSKMVVDIKNWIATSNVTEATGWYVDIADPGDDSPDGAVLIAPSKKERKVKRTLWADAAHFDEADWFRFSATDGVYYNFWVEDTTDKLSGGDARFSIWDSAGKMTSVADADDFDELRRLSLAGGDYRIKVAHAADQAVDTSYRFWYSSVNVGVVSFRSTSVNVSESAPYVDVKLSRSANEGAVSVCFATEALTAIPGQEYYPTNGIISWADGDSSEKTVRVRLIPDLTAKWEEQKKFKVCIWPVAADGLKDGEYQAIIGASDFATVKIKESSAPGPGKVVVSEPDPREVTAGNVLTARVCRVGGSDGRIAVKVKTQASTASMYNPSAPGDPYDFFYKNEVLVWEDGDASDRLFCVTTAPCAVYQDNKMLRLKLSTLATGTHAGNLVPELPENKIYFTIVNQINPGSVVVKEPDPREVLAGNVLTARVCRVGGSSGRIAVKVKTQASTALMYNPSAPGDPYDFFYKNEVLVWEDGDASDRLFCVTTAPCNVYQSNKMLRLKLSTLATGAHAGNLVPELPENKIYFTIWNPQLPEWAPGTPVVTVKGGLDANGEMVGVGEEIKLLKGVYAELDFGAEGAASVTSFQLLQGALPEGLALDGSCIKGVPSAVGKFKATIQPFFGNVAGQPLILEFSVSGCALAYGSFTAVVKEVNDSVDQRMLRLGLLTFTAGVDGKMSAKAKIGSSNYGFASEKGYDAVVWCDKTASGLTRRMSVEMKTPMTGADGSTYENTLKVTVGDGALDNLSALGECAGTVELVMNVIGSDGKIREDVVYSGELVRNNSDSAAFKEALADRVGYYTVALAPDTVVMADGVPAGNGYLMLTVKEDGVATGSGRLADGTEYSYSAPVALRGDLAGSAGVLTVPVFAKTTPYSFGGILKFGGLTEIDSRAALEWNKDGAASSYDGQGFTIDIRPTGGLYNTVDNLQRYYLDYDFEVEAEPVNALAGELLPGGKEYSLDTLPHGVSVSLEGNTVVVPSRVLKMDEQSSAKIDFEASVNAWKVKAAINRVTGLVSGSFQAFSDGEDSSASFGTFNHFGVLLMNRDAFSPLDTDVWSAGAALMPVSENWTLSIPFNIKAVRIDRDWSEYEIPVAE